MAKEIPEKSAFSAADSAESRKGRDRADPSGFVSTLVSWSGPSERAGGFPRTFSEQTEQVYACNRRVETEPIRPRSIPRPSVPAVRLHDRLRRRRDRSLRLI